MKSRTYTSPVRARNAELTRQRILDAAFARFSAQYYDDVTLDAVAADAGVAVQTVLRRFESKEALVRAIVEARAPGVTTQRDEAPAGDVPGAVSNLVDHYEAIGDLVMLLLRQEERVPPFADVTTFGKAYHQGWIDRVFEPWLSARPEDERLLLRAQLVAVCDTYVWYLLRRQQGLTREQTEQALIGLVNGVLQPLS